MLNIWTRLKAIKTPAIYGEDFSSSIVNRSQVTIRHANFFFFFFQAPANQIAT